MTLRRLRLRAAAAAAAAATAGDSDASRCPGPGRWGPGSPHSVAVRVTPESVARAALNLKLALQLAGCGHNGLHPAGRSTL